MGKDKIAIACQGGGSQTAFTAGVLSSLLKEKVRKQYEIVGLSGTSGGAVCAALAWYGLLQADNGGTEPVEKRLEDFWKDNGTQSIFEQYLNDTFVHWLQLINSGLMPHVNSSPYSPFHLTTTSTFEWLAPEFYDFQGQLEKYIDFKAVPKLMDLSKTPVLLLGATDVLRGESKKFNSHRDGLHVEMIMASSAQPSISKAVSVKNRAYWDGLFSDNPPTNDLVDHRQVGTHRLPNQLWVIQVNPKTRRTIPDTADEIIDRRNEMIGNVSLYHGLKHIRLINELIRRKAFIKGYEDDHHLQPVDIYIIQMTSSLQEKLDYASKLNRNAKFIQMLMADGKRQGTAFLKDQESMRY